MLFQVQELCMVSLKNILTSAVTAEDQESTETRSIFFTIQLHSSVRKMQGWSFVCLPSSLPCLHTPWHVFLIFLCKRFLVLLTLSWQNLICDAYLDSTVSTQNAWTPLYPKYYEHVSSPRIPGLYHIQGIDRIKMPDDHNVS